MLTFVGVIFLTIGCVNDRLSSNTELYEPYHAIVYFCMSGTSFATSFVIMCFHTISLRTVQQLASLTAAVIAGGYLAMTIHNLEKEADMTDERKSNPVATVYYYLPLYPAILTALGLQLRVTLALLTVYSLAMLSIFIYFHSFIKPANIVDSDFGTLCGVGVFFFGLFFWVARNHDWLLRLAFLLHTRLVSQQIHLKFQVDDPFHLRAWASRAQRQDHNDDNDEPMDTSGLLARLTSGILSELPVQNPDNRMSMDPTSPEMSMSSHTTKVCVKISVWILICI